MKFSFQKNKPLPLVIGLNQVDKIVEGGWNERLNAPTEEAKREIQRKCEHMMGELVNGTTIANSHMEYYSALKRYRLMPLLAKIVRNTHGGFKLDNVQPADPFEMAHPEVKEYIEEERKKREGEVTTSKSTQLFSELEQHLSKNELKALREGFNKKSGIPPKIAILGKAGVGKTTTINNLFSINWKTSHSHVGTTEAQTKECELPNGGIMTVTDLPGYGRTVKDDKEYEEIYKEIIPSCDLAFLIIQADTRDTADDQEMLIKISKWLKESSTSKQR